MFLEQLKLFQLPEPTPQPKTRHLLINGRIVDYRLRTGARRLTMTIDEQGLRIAAPPRLPLADIEAFVLNNGEWVLAKLADLAQAPHPRHVTIKDGARLPLLDGEIEVRVQPGANRARWIDSTLLLEARASADLHSIAKRALQRRALAHFNERLLHYTERLQVTTPALALSSARTRWGSCSERSGIRINWRLIHLPQHLGDYVMAHEVSHLLEMNHSPRFWATVASIYPDWQGARAELKSAAASLPII